MTDNTNERQDELATKRRQEERETAEVLKLFPAPWRFEDEYGYGHCSIFAANGRETAATRIKPAARLIVASVNYRATRERLGCQGDVEALGKVIRERDEALVKATGAAFRAEGLEEACREAGETIAILEATNDAWRRKYQEANAKLSEIADAVKLFQQLQKGLQK